MSRIPVNGARLYGEVDGTGAPIVFLHGLAVGMRFFEAQLTDLSEQYRTIAFDYRGHARSATTEVGYTLHRYAADLHAVLEQHDWTMRSSSVGP